jgi:transposase
MEFFAALPHCLVGIEACPTAHHWSRKLQMLVHTVRLMPPSYVRAYVKRSRNVPMVSYELTKAESWYGMKG